MFCVLHAAFLIHVTVCNASGTSDGDYVGTLTSLFKDIAAAVEENEEFVAASFGQGALLKFVAGLQEVSNYSWLPVPYMDA